MYTSESTRLKQHWVVVLTLLSITIPSVAIMLRTIAAPLTNSVEVSDERLTLMVLVLGIVCAVGALINNLAVDTPWLRRLGIVVAAVGGLITMYLFWTLIGNCGLQVIWDSCRP